jgi:cation diffusion facilitator family transporter
MRGDDHTIKATLISLFCNVILVSIKTVALLMVNSLAIAVDLGISFVGLIVSVILYYSIKLANRPADLVHNYGYGKVEHVCEAMEGVVLIGIALAMSFQAATHIFHPRVVALPVIGLASSMTASIINFVGAFYILKMAKKSASPAIYAEAVHYRMEAYISGMIGVSFIVSMSLHAGGMEKAAAVVDPITAFLVSAILIVPSFKLAKRSFFSLLDASVEEGGQIEILKQLTKYMKDFCEFKDLKTRSAGRNKFVELKIVLPENIIFKEGHDLVMAIENDISSSMNNCAVTVKMEPCKKDCVYVKSGKSCPYLK